MGLGFFTMNRTVQPGGTYVYGEPEFFLDSSSKADELTVRISYIDDTGRSADVVAVAAVTR